MSHSSHNRLVGRLLATQMRSAVSRGLARRQFLSMLAGGSVLALGSRVFGDEMPTPAQTSGPFYPKPEILKQSHYDADLTRKAADSPVAQGEIVVVRGQIVDVTGQPIGNAKVEVWQACDAGKYNHPDDNNTAPLDPNFQYWAHIVTDKEGKYSFKSIQPGKYPGRTPHIHYRVMAQDFDELITQMYFENRGSDNSKDGIYKSLNKKQQESVTVAFAKNVDFENLPTGDFKIVLGPKGAKNATPPM